MRTIGSAAYVLWAFLLLGLSSFGGPIAHIGYFRKDFVDRRGWVTSADFTSLVAMCQFLPGPASSQLGYCIGLRRAGWLGGVCAWLGFTLPSAIIMLVAAHYIGRFQTIPLARGAMHGLQLAAAAVVAQAVWTMARTQCPDTPRRALAVLAVAILVIIPDTGGQILVLLVGAAFGRLALETRSGPRLEKFELSPVAHRRAATFSIAAYFVLLASAFLAPENGTLALFSAFYRAGALVFGGGHVVLPTLRDAVVVPTWVSPQMFLAGYGAAQAVPGPLFTVAAFLGSVAANGPGGPVGGLIALAGIFLPGLLLAGGVMPYWQFLQDRPGMASTMMGVNAAVVGLLGAALISLLSLSAVQSFWDGPIVLAALALLTFGRARPILVVVFCAAAGAIL